MKKYQEPEIEIIRFEMDEPVAAGSGADDNHIPLDGDKIEF